MGGTERLCRWQAAVTPCLMPVRWLRALGTGHILRAGVTQELQSRGTAHTGQLWARHTAHRSGKVRERWHSPRAQSCEDRQRIQSWEKGVSHTLSYKQELPPRARPHLWQQRSGRRPILSPGVLQRPWSALQLARALSISASSLRGHARPAPALTAVPHSPGPSSYTARE